MNPDQTYRSLKRSIKNRAIELGFSAIGFARSEELKNDFQRYIEWLNKGYHADMNYLERNLDKRKDPSFILPECKTVIMLSCNYYTGLGHNNLNNHGKISNYAWGEDYHHIIPPMLDRLAEFISESIPGTNCKSYTDTGSILEKVWARKAGLGWQGKNSLMLQKNHGSYFFIGTILTTAEFEPDKESDNHCGNCTACLDSCPTKAITEPMVVDSSKCISYWTIETKGKKEYPKEVSDKLGDWLFGCDICQQVCPWNKKAKISQIENFLPINHETEIELSKLNVMSNEEFKARFRNSPVGRAKLSGLKLTAKYLTDNDQGS